jgi:hypothetical protein
MCNFPLTQLCQSYIYFTNNSKHLVTHFLLLFTGSEQCIICKCALTYTIMVMRAQVSIRTAKTSSVMWLPSYIKSVNLSNFVHNS